MCFSILITRKITALAVNSVTDPCTRCVHSKKSLSYICEPHCPVAQTSTVQVAQQSFAEFTLNNTTQNISSMMQFSYQHS